MWNYLLQQLQGVKANVIFAMNKALDSSFQQFWGGVLMSHHQAIDDIFQGHKKQLLRHLCSIKFPHYFKFANWKLNFIFNSVSLGTETTLTSLDFDGSDKPRIVADCACRHSTESNNRNHRLEIHRRDLLLGFLQTIHVDQKTTPDLLHCSMSHP